MATGLLIHGIIFLVLPLYSSCLRMTITGTAMKIWRDSITMEAGKGRVGAFETWKPTP